MTRAEASTSAPGPATAPATANRRGRAAARAVVHLGLRGSPRAEMRAAVSTMATVARLGVRAASATAVAIAAHTAVNARLLRVPPPAHHIGQIHQTDQPDQISRTRQGGQPIRSGQPKPIGQHNQIGQIHRIHQACETHQAGRAGRIHLAGRAGQTDEHVSVVLPVRDEAAQVGDCLAAILASTGVPAMEVVVYDDASTDATAAVVADVAGRDGRVVLIRGGSLPAGWLGKPHACARGAARAGGSVLVFIDADVRLAPDGLVRTVALLRASGLDLVCPYPRQLAGTVAERLVQPLLQWSWLALLPLRAAERSSRPSLSAANGQLLCVDADAYRRVGGHAAVASSVLEDVELLRVFKRAGCRGVVADGTDIATVRMYNGWGALQDGYGKSLWAAGGASGPYGSAAQVALLGWVFVVPAVAALAGSRAGLAGYLAAVASRVVAARVSGGRSWPDALAHPVSVTLFGYLTGLSWWRHRRGSATWKDRPV